MSKAKQTMKYIIESIGKIGTNTNKAFYEKLFKGMSDKDFDVWFNDFLADDKSVLNVIIPQDGSIDISFERNEKLAKEFDVEFFGPLVIEDQNGKITKPNIDYMVLDAFIRVPQQTVDKGSRVSTGKVPNPLTGQLNTASKITAPENGILWGLGLKETMIELNRIRSGDVGLQSGLRTVLSTKGKVSKTDLIYHKTGITSTKSLNAYFKALHMNLFPNG